MLSILRPLIAFEAQRQAVNARAHWMRWAAIVLAALFLVVSQFHSLASGGMVLVGSGLPMLAGLVWLNYVFIGIAALGLFATSITNERESGTLPLLVVADIPFRPFVVGKWAQFLFPAALIVLLELPLLAGATFFGGVTYVQAFSASSVLASYLFFSSTAGMLFSVLFRTSNRAVFATCTLLAVCEFSALSAEQLLAAQRDGMLKLGAKATPYLLSIAEQTDWSAFHVLTQISSGATPQRLVVPLSADLVGRHVIMGLLCLTGAAYFAKRLAAAVEGGPVLRKKEVARESRRVFGEPVRWKEFRFHVHGWSGIAFRVVAYGLATIASIYVIQRFKLSARDGWSTLAGILAVIGLIDLASMATRIFGAEQKQRTLATLLLTSHRSGDLFWKKLFGLLPAVCVTLAVLITAEAIRPDSASPLVREYWAMGVFTVASIAVWLQLIVVFSLDFPSISAFAASVGLVVVWILVSIVATIWVKTVGQDVDRESVMIASSYLLGLFAFGAHIVGVLRLDDAASK